MNCTFFRTNTVDIDTWNLIIHKLEMDLMEFESGSVSREEAIEYLMDLINQAKPLPNDQGKYAFGMDDPETMPSDARVDFFYRPTYIASTIIMVICLRYPTVLSDLPTSEEIRKILSGCLDTCTGRDFGGSGIEWYEGLVETMKLFSAHRVGEFVRKYGHISPRFTECYKRTLNEMMSDIVQGKAHGMFGSDLSDEVREILIAEKRILSQNEFDQSTYRYYIAYGSNLNLDRMFARCPSAKLVGVSELENSKLMYKLSKTGYYLTVEPATGEKVPVAVWALTAKDEARQDRYEGYPHCYYKKDFDLSVTTCFDGSIHKVDGFAYLLPSSRPAGKPTDDYVKCCMEGYKAFGFDQSLLKAAISK